MSLFALILAGIFLFALGGVVALLIFDCDCMPEGVGEADEHERSEGP